MKMQVHRAAQVLVRLACIAALFSVCSSEPPAEATAQPYPPEAGSWQKAIKPELGPLLSPQASIYLPPSAEFANATDRYDESKKPTITAVVKVATEGDIKQTVLFANKYDVPFLVKGSGHGFIDTLGNMKYGIQIWTRNMNSVKLAEDGQTALVGPGALSKEVVYGLRAHKKQTTTGACECTGIAGPLLGGGKGWLMGRYGLVTDQLVEARMVLADGSLVTVSEKANQDLFWAIRGAGHNFGVVTQFKIRVHDVKELETWGYELFTFKGDKVEKIFAQLNKIYERGTPPVALSQYVMFARVPALDPVNPILLVSIMHEGTLADEKPYGAPFHAMDPINVESGITDLPGIAAVLKLRVEDPLCQHGISSRLVPVDLNVFNISVQRQVYDYFAEFSARPEFNRSGFLWEGYSVAGVKAVPADSTAVPDRDSNLLVSPGIIYAPNPALDDIAAQAGEHIRKLLQDGTGSSQLRAYVNYATGTETLPEIYGHEPWRLQRLRALKQKYDPKGRFNFYAPIR